ncbi:MAG: hypothetical protein FWG38_00705 [Defluviitaleaceae bacterium]|nr:hypothetical protein [Defluviitaleaceae bacterium]
MSMLIYCNKCWKDISEIEDGICAHCGTYTDVDEIRNERLAAEQVAQRHSFFWHWIFINIGLFLLLPLSLIIFGGTSLGAALLMVFLVLVLVISHVALAITAITTVIKRKMSAEPKKYS